jgi:hypothetical protein
MKLDGGHWTMIDSTRGSIGFGGQSYNTSIIDKYSFHLLIFVAFDFYINFDHLYILKLHYIMNYIIFDFL